MTIDGEASPSLWGTGSEDYFSGAWCYGDTFYNDYFGMPYREKNNHDPDNFWNVYRYHIENPVTFRKSIRVEIEHGTSGYDNTRRGGWNNDYSSVAYWYMDKPVKLKGEVPPAGKRISQYRPLIIAPNVYEFQNCTVSSASGSVSPGGQDMALFEKDGAEWLMADHLFCGNNVNGSTISLRLQVVEEQSGPSVLVITKAPDYGRVNILLDGKTIVADFNGYAERVVPALVPLGDLKLEPGEHIVTVKTLGKDERSKGYLWGLDYLRIGGEPLEIEGRLKALQQ